MFVFYQILLFVSSSQWWCLTSLPLTVGSRLDIFPYLSPGAARLLLTKVFSSASAPRSYLLKLNLFLLLYIYIYLFVILIAFQRWCFGTRVGSDQITIRVSLFVCLCVFLFFFFFPSVQRRASSVHLLTGRRAHWWMRWSHRSPIHTTLTIYLPKAWTFLYYLCC